MVNRQNQLALCFFDVFLCQLHLVFFHKGFTNIAAHSLQEGISHTATDQDFISLFQQVVYNSNLIGNLSSTDDCNKRTLWCINCSTQHLHFFFYQEAQCIWQNGCDTCSGSMCTVYTTECILYKQIAQFCPVSSQLRIIFAFAFFITSILHYDDFPVIQCSNCIFKFFTACNRNEGNLRINQLTQTLSNTAQIVLCFIFLCLNLTKVGHQNNLCVVFH